LTVLDHEQDADVVDEAGLQKSHGGEPGTSLETDTSVFARQPWLR
jgi:hypothetical protein